MRNKEKFTDSVELEPSLVAKETSVQKQQRDVLLEAINDYLNWRNNKSAPDNRGYPPTIFTWFYHYTAFGEIRATHLKQALSADPTSDPIKLLQEHFKKHSKLNNHSLDTYLLEAILKNKQLFLIAEFTNLNTQNSRAALRKIIMEQDANPAAEQRHPTVAFYLGQFYQADHKDRQKKDATLAFHSYLQAAKLGHRDALKALDNLGHEVSAEYQLALSQLYETFFHNQEKSLYWRDKANEIGQFDIKM